MIDEITSTRYPSLSKAKGHWLFKNVPGMRRDILRHFHQWGDELGHTFENPVPFMRIIATADPGFMQYVLQSNHRNYKKGRPYRVLKLILGNGLVTSNGSLWQTQRRLAQPAFYKKNLQHLFVGMCQSTKEYFAELEQKRGTEIDLTKEMMAVSARVVLKALFSDKTEEDLHSIYDSMTEALRYVALRQKNPIPPALFQLSRQGRRFAHNKRNLYKVVLTAISNRRQTDKKHPDLLQMMMDARFKGSCEHMNDQQLRDEMITMFSAGYETTANGLSWTLYLLTQHPKIMERVRSEIQSLLGNRLPGFQDLARLGYLLQVIRESMRLYPPVWSVSRTAIAADAYRGIKINKNDLILCLIYNTHHREDIYENASAFNPDRFAAEKVKTMDRMSYLPFGGGPRSCIGNRFALMEMQLILIGLLQRFDFELMPNQKIEMEAMVTLRPKYGIKMKLW